MLFSLLPGCAGAEPGTPFPPEGPAQPQAVAVARTALAGDTYGADGRWYQASLPLGRTALLMRVESGTFCGDAGCPVAVLLQGPQGWSAGWNGISGGKGRVLSGAHHGLRDILLYRPGGQRVLAFDGHAYVERR